MHPKIYLKPGKEKPVQAHHHWVFSGAILKKDPGVLHGGVVDVCTSDHKYLGTGYYNERTSIAVRILSFEPVAIDGNFLWNKIFRARSLRIKSFTEENTNCYRYLFSEGDFLPGLIIDRYGSGLVIQIQTKGMEVLRPVLLEVLEVMMKPSFIFEKSEGASRSEEGLEPVQTLHYGTLPETPLPVLENGMRLLVDIPGGQKTGLFLDQRDNRQLIREWSRNKTVVNCFGYTGGFSIAAALGGATRTVTVDTSGPALALARENLAINGLDPANHELVNADVFEYLRQLHDKPELIILDPPAFARKQQAMTAAFRGYKDINTRAIKSIAPGGWLLTCSCSYYMDTATFQKALFMAAVDAGRELQIVRRLGQPLDHPVNIFHPECEYLKAFLCKVH